MPETSAPSRADVAEPPASAFRTRRVLTPLALVATVSIGVTGLAVSPSAAAPAGGVRINEVESTDGDPGDWIEFFNTGESAVDLSGFTVKDDKDDHAYVFPAGTELPSGGYLVIDELSGDAGEFDFGLGKSDTVRLFDATGALSDEFSWDTPAEHTYGVNASGEWAMTSAATKGSENVFETDGGEEQTPLAVLNEIDSSPADWVELYNPRSEASDISGFELRDNSDDHRWAFPEGSVIAPGGLLVVDDASVGLIDGVEGTFAEAIGIGSADKIRLFDASGTLIDDSGEWEGHAEIDGDAAKATLARCPNGQGDFVLATPTPGDGNKCVEDPGSEEPEGPTLETAPWPGPAEARAIDTEAMFLEDSSGLDTQQTSEGTFLWAVDNGEGRFWKLAVAADGSASFAEGWAEGKRARFQKDAANPDAAGPDTEGITVAGDGLVYLASERDNSAKGVNFDVVLQVDPEDAGPDVVASQEWDLTALLPEVSANLGIEAIEWVSDADLAGKLFDTNTGAAYDPASYPQHGDGLFFVAVEDGGRVFAFALGSDGSAQQVAEVKPGLAGVMALDWDTVRGGLWAVCDDGCDGASAFVTLNGSADPDLQHFARPEGVPNTNNEGFATAPAALIVDGRRPAWWFTDGVQPGALHAGWLTVTEDPDDGSDGSSDADGTGGSDGTDGTDGTDGGADGSGDSEGGDTGSDQTGTTNRASAKSLATTGAGQQLWAPALALVLAGLAGIGFSARRRS